MYYINISKVDIEKSFPEKVTEKKTKSVKRKTRTHHYEITSRISSKKSILLETCVYHNRTTKTENILKSQIKRGESEREDSQKT